MKAFILSLERWTTGAATVLACVMLAVASALGVFQIFTRFVLEQPAEWTEVLIRFSLIWMVFLGIPLAFRQGAMVSVDALYQAVPRSAKRVLDVVVALAALLLMLIILWWGSEYAVRGSVQTVAGMESISMFWAYLALPVGAAPPLLRIAANYLDPRPMELETAQ